MTTRRDPETGDALVIEFTFQQIRRVTLKTRRAEAAVRPKDMTLDISKQVSPNQAQGQVVGKEVVMDLGETTLTGVVQ
jgi:hypothetical protein